MAALAATPGLRAGRPWPLGAHVEDDGVNFALFSAHATRVELCLLQAEGEMRLELPACTDQVWHGFLPGVGAGTRAEGGADRAGAPVDRAGPAGAPPPAPRRRPHPRERHLIHEIAT